MIHIARLTPMTNQKCGTAAVTANSCNSIAVRNLSRTVSAALPSCRLLLTAIVTVGACLHANLAHGLEAMDDKEMGTITGQKGILLSLQYYYNSHPDLDGGPVSECATPNGGTSLNNMDCRFAVQLKNREDEWLVFKNGHASIDLTHIALDASILGDSRGASNTSLFNAEKFQDVDGSCLLHDGCSPGSIADMAGLRLSYPEGTNGANFGNVRFGMFFEGLAVEPNALAPNNNGWEGTQNGSFMGLNIADNAGHQANIAFGGDFYLYGF